MCFKFIIFLINLLLYDNIGMLYKLNQISHAPDSLLVSQKPATAPYLPAKNSLSKTDYDAISLI